MSVSFSWFLILTLYAVLDMAFFKGRYPYEFIGDDQVDNVVGVGVVAYGAG